METSSSDDNNVETFVYTDYDSGLRNSSEAQKHREIEAEFPKGSTDLSRMIDIVENSPSRYSQVSAMVFREVIEPIRIEDWKAIQQQLNEFKISIGFDKLAEGIYQKNVTSPAAASASSSDCVEKKNTSSTSRTKSRARRLYGGKMTKNKKKKKNKRKKRKTMTMKTKSRLLLREVFLDDYLRTAAEASDYIQHFFETYERTDEKFDYYYNSDQEIRPFPFLLDNIVQSGIHTKVHPSIASCPGINTSMSYLGTKNSFTEMHCEDGLLDSLNAHTDSDRKLWIIVEHYDYLPLNSNLCEDLSDNDKIAATSSSSTSETLKSYIREKCPYPTHHKELLLMAKYLDSKKINYRYIFQNSGDVVYLKNAVAHQVWNLGTNFAEAINFGSVRWRYCNALLVLCKYPRKQLSSIETDPIACDNIVRRRRSKLPCKCPIDGCESFYKNIGDLEKHLIEKTENHGVLYYCLYCRSRYTTLGNLHRHLRDWHCTSLRNMKYAYYCLRRLTELKYFSLSTTPSPSNSPVTGLAAADAENIRKLKFKVDRDSAISSGKNMMAVICDYFVEREKKKTILFNV